MRKSVEPITESEANFGIFRSNRIAALVCSAITSFVLALPYHVLLVNPFAADPNPRMGFLVFFVIAMILAVTLVSWGSLAIGVLAAFTIVSVANSLATRFVPIAKRDPIVGWLFSAAISSLVGLVLWLLLRSYLPPESVAL